MKIHQLFFHTLCTIAIYGSSSLLGFANALSATTNKSSSPSSSVKTFHFGGGCFWAPEDNIKKVPGVISTAVGYCGDDTPFKSTPTYEKVCGGRTKLVEAVRVEYDSDTLSFEDMLSLYAEVNTAEWENKRQYRGIIFTSSNEEKEVASQFLQNNEGIVAEIEPVSKTFYTAEKYHQDYWGKWRVRIASIVTLLATIGVFGGDLFGVEISQKLYNVFVWGFILFTLVERRLFSDQKVITIGDSK
jgi:methionine-S-sulfoxide reductase